MSPVKTKMISLVVGFVFLVLWPTAASAEITIEDPGTFVVDTADIVDDTVQVRLEGWFRELEQRTTAQIKVLTIETTGGEDFFGFVQRHAEEWKLGQKAKDNGALIALALKERRVRIQTGYGLEGVLPDSWAGSISRYMARRYFAKGQYSEGLYWLAIAVTNKVADAENVQLSGIPDYRYRIARGAEPSYSGWEKYMAAGAKAYQQGRYAVAEKSLQAALKEAERFGPQDERLAVTLNDLAALYGAQGRHSRAEPLQKRALAVREKVFGPEHPQVAQSLHNLASLYQLQGRYAEAEPLHKRSLAIWEKTLGPAHPDVAQSLNNLASLYEAQGRYPEAEPLYKRALAIREKALGPEHPHVGTTLNNLAGLYRAQGKYAEAEPLHKRSLAIFEKALGPEHPEVATSLNNLAALYKTQGRYAEAEPLYKRSLAIWEKALGPEHPLVATSLENYASLLRETNREPEAAELETRAKAIRAKHAREKATK
ncbi:MAG: tetratricopeptide repeat protein [Acidobacteriota bacterium]